MGGKHGKEEKTIWTKESSNKKGNICHVRVSGDSLNWRFMEGESVGNFNSQNGPV